jgi:energy-coupling factor transporter transmembrane protein EcfT
LGIAALSAPAHETATRLRLIALWTLPFAVPLFVIHGVLNPAYAITWDAGWIPVRADGIAFAAVITGRLCLVAAAASAWRGIPRLQLIALAQALRLPDSVTVTIASAASATAVVDKRIQNVLLAQQARGLETRPGVRRRIGALLTVGLPVVTTTIVDAHHRGAVVASRGFGFGQMSRIELTRIRRSEWIRIALISLGAIALAL